MRHVLVSGGTGGAGGALVRHLLGAVPYDPRQVMRLEVDIRRLKQDTGFEPRWSFEDGIAAILAYKNPQIC